MSEALNVLIFFPGCTRGSSELERVLTALDNEPLLAPTHASPDERKRVPYDRPDAVTVMANRYGGLQLWRTKAPKYEGSLTTLDWSHNKLVADIKAPFRSHDLPDLFDATTRIAEALKPEFGFIHKFWKKGEVSEQYNRGIRIGLKELVRLGLSTVHARTWFGPDLAHAIGEAQLLALPGARRTAWNGVQLDLVEQPWTADFEVLSQKQREVLDVLGPLGVLGNYAGAPSMRTPAPNWPELPWRVPRNG